MSLCAIDLDWADGHYSFALPLAQLEELQDKCDAGPVAIFRRLTDQTWRTADVYQTLRLGLIGGGMKPLDALALSRRYVLERPWLENVPVAQAILGIALQGKPDDPVGKPAATRKRASRAAKAKSSASPTSMESAR